MSKSHTSGSSPRYAGVPAGPAEGAHANGFSAGHLGGIGDHFATTARVAGTAPARPGDSSQTVRRCLRTVDSGLALCCALPAYADLRPGAVVDVVGVVTGHRAQGSNDVTEICAESIDVVG